MVKKPYESYESGDYLASNPTWDEEDSEWKARQVINILKKNNLSPTSIVEVGCGAGGILASLCDVLPNVEYSGFEITPDASKFWEKHEPKNIKFQVSDFLQIQTDFYDVLLLLDVFEHVPNPFEFLSGLKGRAGYYVFHIPLDLSALSVARESPLLYVRKKVGHIHYYTKGLALSLLEESGYTIVDWSYTGAAFTVPQVTWKNRLSRLPRKILFGINRDLGVRLLGGDTLIVLAKA
jgi:cyclopropane fatty-acyl-phospholipid synthase-like methyltransferase